MTSSIYMLEDDNDDRLLTRDILDELKMDVNIRFFSSSNELLNQIAVEKPALVMVDYNSNPQNGIQVLKHLKSSAETSYMPVVILTESKSGNLRKECYQAGASSVIVKPSDMLQTREKIQTFFSYWLNVVEVV